MRRKQSPNELCRLASQQLHHIDLSRATQNAQRQVVHGKRYARGESLNHRYTKKLGVSLRATRNPQQTFGMSNEKSKRESRPCRKAVQACIKGHRAIYRAKVVGSE
ncbi:hypothetical protein K437DRAFT_140327 [Tilletiaria anomala UBC 951]|uniref:Uncharacterized protein n=1 Tax=Tilletiaria anomala (strain ATCC 24038 / CBS 436.72 / UBC 951) TaxID=1037660 RepID=A0A066VVF6_TILAU|nr:uncharacterized protein K437DRAFT_140327 [Tilletiaria anomala UBC 951]KDN44263.1 hypothetical protein K437DRAFT_140327 [Tilletiaria anomala UBC 951]